MTQAVFDKSLEIANEFGSTVTIGGGEPTLHPKIMDWIVQAAIETVETSKDLDGPAVLVITNGKRTDTAIKIAKLAHLGMIQAQVSQDEYHDPISDKVFTEFRRYAISDGISTRGYAGVRNTSSNLTKRGRADENGIWSYDGCCCDALFIKPNGDFYQCGCQITKLGNILRDEIPAHCFDNAGECEVSLEKRNAAELVE